MTSSSLIKCGAAVLLTVLVSALAACGGNGPETEKKIRVSVAPSAACNAIEARRRLGANPPAIGLFLFNIDVDNFSGKTSAICNERQIVYFEQSDFPGRGRGGRRGVFVRFAFPDNIAGAERLLIAGRDAGRLNGRRVVLSGGDGKRSASLRVGPAIVTVTVGCAGDDNALKLVPCDSARGLDEYLETVSLSLLPALEDRLK